jgi:cation diffusion facilitator CzcD-associated flavoprotein CzcO
MKKVCEIIFLISNKNENMLHDGIITGCVCMIKKFLLLFFFVTHVFADPMQELEQAVAKDLQFLDYPAKPWRKVDPEVCDVAIIGSGMRGLALAFSLQLEGVTNVKLFDAADDGKEGPWLTSARMKTLRSGKKLQGPACGIPHLTFRAWYEAQYGASAWEELGNIPTALWGDYLCWLKKVLQLEVYNKSCLESIIPNEDNTLTLYFSNQTIQKTRHVVLATGRCGFGGPKLPCFAASMPKKFWAHTSEEIDHAFFKDKRICVIGAGSSAFDAAACALENGAKGVQMLMRKESIPKKNLFAMQSFRGFHHGFYFLPDEARCELFCEALETGVPPPEDSLKRVEKFSTFKLHSGVFTERVEVGYKSVLLHTNKGRMVADFIIFATGYDVDGSRQKELARVYDKIRLWKDQVETLTEKIGNFPYLGQYFEFLPKEGEYAPFLERIHCFNYGAFLSCGRISGDIDCFDVGIRRLVEGIVQKLFLESSYNEAGQDPCSCTYPGSCQY